MSEKGANARGLTTRNLAAVAVRTLLLAPAVILTAGAAIAFPSSLALERAFPVPAYLSMNVALPVAAYDAAESALAGVDVRDGISRILRAEAAMLAGRPAAEVTSILESALGRAPASARGWTLLAELRASGDARAAADAFGLALDFAPFDYWLAARQAKDAVRLWAVLPEGAKSSAARQARLLWSERDLRPEIRPLLRSSEGVELMTRAFEGDPEELRAFNRWLAADRRASDGKNPG